MKRVPIAALFMSSCLSLAFQPALASDIHDAFFAAMQSPQGTYSGELKGNLAEYLHKTLKTTAPVYVSVSTVRTFRQKGCKRLKSEISMPDFKTANTSTTRKPFLFLFEINLCPDGSPPLEAVAPTTARQATQTTAIRAGGIPKTVTVTAQPPQTPASAVTQQRQSVPPITGTSQRRLTPAAGG